MLARALLAAALTGAAAVPALAQDGPPVPPAPPAAPPAAPAAPTAPEAPAKHENKVSDAAKAVWAGMEKVAYNPVNAGLKEMQGKMRLNLEVPGMDESSGMPPMTADFAITFKAPADVTVEASSESPMLQMQLDGMKQQVKQLLTMSLGQVRTHEGEYDADVEEKDGKKFLVVKMYEKNEPRGEMKMEMDARGLPSKGTIKATDPMTGMEGSMDMSYTYAAEGDRFILEKLLVTNPMGNTSMNFKYTDAGGMKLMTEIRGSIEAMGIGMVFKYVELTANGKKVELPAEKPAEQPAGTPTAPGGAVPPAPPPPSEGEPK
jgi:hypothetical protein